MTVFEALAPTQPTAEQGALRVKRTLALAFQQIENSLAQVREIIERHGRGPINSALGADEGQVAALYTALQEVLEENKPDTDVPDLPN